MKVVVTRKLPDAVEARLAERFDAELNRADAPFGRERLREAMGRCDVLAPNVRDRIDAELIAGAGERLRLIANFGAGTDNIDVEAARSRGIAVTNTPDVLTEDTADLVMALILIGPRRLGEGERNLRSGRWRGWGPTDQLGRSLTGKSLGIVGLGRIGKAVARRARAFGMTIHYHNRRPVVGEEALYWPDLDALLAAVDVVSLNAPYGPATRNLIDRRRLGLMKADAWLINAARGGLVDEEALIEALGAGRIAGAGLDVYPNEPEVNPRLLDLPNLVLLPHLGSATLESRTAMGEKVLANIAAFAAGRDLPDRIA
ncbi:MAG TPA: D-glycerate dehydrogenase [Allosphingosinicella sp.]|jgi:glyoxylate reductase|nr:D-glycerate dehydrogenase [Allosphingosinicella sp.]